MQFNDHKEQLMLLKRSGAGDKENVLLVISGPSAGVGKDSIEKGLAAKCKLETIVTYTTRLPREGEKDGVDYHFIDRHEFEKKIQAGFFLEHEIYLDNYYGTPRDEVFRKIDQGVDVVVRVDVRGAQSIKRVIPQARLVYIAPPDFKHLKLRLLRRNDNAEMIEKKLETARWEIEQRVYFDHVVVNEEGKLEEAVGKVKDILEKERNENELGKKKRVL